MCQANNGLFPTTNHHTMTKEQIVNTQLDLTTLGYWNKGVNGQDSPELKEAVRLYQKARGLVADGIAGKITTGELAKQIGRRIQLLVIHCSATPEGLAVTAQAIVDYHIKTKGWSRPGYSDIVELDGKLVNVRLWNDDDIITEWEVTNGILTQFNRNARHICYIGGKGLDGKTKDTRNIDQSETLENYVLDHIKMHPNIVVIGHRAIQRKGCPSFAVPKWLRSLDVAEKNIGDFCLYK